MKIIVAPIGRNGRRMQLVGGCSRRVIPHPYRWGLIWRHWSIHLR